ncbi:karyopherin Kap95 [Coemansia sp. RSA 1972]|nr:karyopherin Kap95 [Coemansia sp. RSA 1972]
MSFAEILGGTLSPDANVRDQATRALESAESENFAHYVLSLTRELASESAQPSVRSAAGIALKNALTAKDETRQEQHSQRWLQVDEGTRSQVKQGVLVTLGSDNRQATMAAAQAIAAITATELPQGQWQDVITTLLQNVSTTSTGLKIASLQTIGFICESINPDILATQSNLILTAVIQGATAEEQSQEVRYAAITALLNSLEFVRQNFENEGERNVIMQTVCEATQSPDSNVQAAAFECLVRIMQLYYDKMRFYMEKALYGLTVIGMKHEDEKIALQAIEFWSTVCDEEIELQIEEETREPGQPAERDNYQFAKTTLPQVLPTLLFLLTKQDEDADEDEWNVSMAAATCLSLLAQTIGNDIVAPVIPFVEQNIRNPDWHHREAAVMAFGSILDGPDPNVLTPLVSQALPVLIEMVKDQVVQVKDSAAWTLGRVCDLPIECIQLDVHLHSMISALVAGLEDSPRIVANCCWAVMNLTEQLGGTDLDTYAMSQYFEGIVTTLMRITEANVNENNSRTSAYEAMATLASTGARDTHAVIAKLGVAILDRLDATIAGIAQAVGIDDRLALAELQSNLLNVLTNVARTLGRQISEISDRIMTSVLQLLNATNGKQAAAAEDAFLLVGALITALESDFTRYLDSFSPFLYNALQNHEEYQLCSISVGLIGDICRSLGQDAAQHCDQFMTILLQNLESNVLHRDVKPSILSCFGDIALAIGGRFETYLEVTFRVLMSACNLSAGTQAVDFDTIDYNNQLRVGIFEAFVGITQGFKSDGKAQLILSQVQSIIGFMNFVYNDQTRSDDVTKGMIGLLGDLADAFPGGEIREYLRADWIQALIREGRSSARGTSLRVISRWARDMVKQATA